MSTHSDITQQKIEEIGEEQKEMNEARDPVELDSKSILIQNKRFYLDVKENDRGRFLKIAEVTPGGHKNRVTMAMQLLPEFRDNLSDFIDHYANLGPSTVTDDNDEDQQNRRPLKTARIVSGPRRYFLDLKENVRGRYLRVRAPGQQRDMPQQVVVIPASGMIEFRDTVSTVIDEFGVEQYKSEAEINEEDLPASSTIGSRRTKVFYMDVGKNNRGIYCRMTEQSANFRQSLTVPDRYFRELGEWFLNAADHLDSNGNIGAGDNTRSHNANSSSTNANQSSSSKPVHNQSKDSNKFKNKKGTGYRNGYGNVRNNRNNDDGGLAGRRRSRDDDEYSE